MDLTIPGRVPNWIGGSGRPAADAGWFEKRSPVTGKVLWQVARSRQADVEAAVTEAAKTQPAWAAMPAVQRGRILFAVAQALREHREVLARAVATESGKSMREALGEVDGAIDQGMFMGGEGQRLYGRTTTSGVANRSAMTVRCPVGIAGLIIAANAPIANIAWKVFPALICGNAALLKAAEDTPAIAWMFARLAESAGLPAGLLNVIQGFGEEAGAPIVEHASIGVISFTGSSEVGRIIAVNAGRRLAKISLELGGKNPFVVCDDADLGEATRWAIQSAFSNAGQRCASGSRIIVMNGVYDEFRARLVAATRALSIGPNDSDAFGPVINDEQLQSILGRVHAARLRGASVAVGGERLTGQIHRDGYYMAPTILEDVPPDDAMSCEEVFGPVTILYRVASFAEAVELANRTPYGLTACIHTRSFDRAVEFTKRANVGVAVVNGGTHGSEPHMPFGGAKGSGNGSREPGTEALDIYSNLRDVYFHTDPAKA